MSVKPDLIGQMVRIQQRAIRRATGYWIAAAERLQAGDLTSDVWLTAYVECVEGFRDDLDEALAAFARREVRERGQG